MKSFLRINLKLPTAANNFLENLAEHVMSLLISMKISTILNLGVRCGVDRFTAVSLLKLLVHPGLLVLRHSPLSGTEYSIENNYKVQPINDTKRKGKQTKKGTRRTKERT